MSTSVGARVQYSRRWLSDFGLSANLADSTESLEQGVREGHPVKHLAKRLDALERAVKRGTPQDAFQLGETIAFFTGQHPVPGMGPVRSASSRPRQVDFELLTHVVSGYRVLDIHLATVDRSQDATISTRRTHKMGPGRATVVEGYLSITDWTALVAGIPDLVQEGVAEDSVQLGCGAVGDLASLAKNWIRAGDTAAISRISSHLHLCAMYLWCLCDPTNTDDIFTMQSAVTFFQRWHARLEKGDVDPHQAMSAYEQTKFRQKTCSASALKHVRNGFEAVFLETPLLTLRTSDLFSPNYRPNKCDMLQATRSRLIRTEKPKALALVEYTLYTGMLDLAFSNAVSCSQVLRRVAEAVKGVSLEQAVPSWFSLSLDLEEPRDPGSTQPTKKRRLASPPPSSPLASSTSSLTGSTHAQLLIATLGLHTPRATPEAGQPLLTESPQLQHLVTGTLDPHPDLPPEPRKQGPSQSTEKAPNPLPSATPDIEMANGEPPPSPDSRSLSAEPTSPTVRQSSKAITGASPGATVPKKRETKSSSGARGGSKRKRKRGKSEGGRQNRGEETEEEGQLEEGGNQVIDADSEGELSRREEDDQTQRGRAPAQDAGSEDEDEDEVELLAEPLLLFESLNLPRVKAPPAVKQFIPSLNCKRPRKEHRWERGLRSVTFHDIRGKAYEYTPCLPQGDLSAFYAIHDAIKEDYVDGLPMHIARPQESAFKFFPQDQFALRAMTDAPALRQDFAEKEFVVRDPHFQPHPRGFSPQTLNSVHPLHGQLQAHDYSLDWSLTLQQRKNGETRHVSTTLNEIHKEHLRGDEGKIMNALDIPLLSNIQQHPLFTQLEAFRSTQSYPLPTCQDYPVRDVNWALVATKDAHHGWHIDSDGFCTFVTVQAGLKLWVIAVPKDPSVPFLEAFVDIKTFLSDWVIDGPNRKHYRLEALVLCPGDTLLFKAFRPHLVVTLSSSICVGGHFYCGGTMSESVASLITSLLLEPLITNTLHINSRFLLQRMAVHCYDFVINLSPLASVRSMVEIGYDLSSFNGWHAFIMLHAAVVLGPALDPRFYHGWGNAKASVQDNLMIAYARGTALTTIARLSCMNITVKPMGPATKGITPQQYFDSVLLQTAVLYYRAFTHITHRSDRKEITSHLPSHAERTKQLLRQALCHDQELLLKFDQEIAPPFPSARPKALPAIPLPSKIGVVTIIDQKQAPQTRRQAEPDSLQLARKGATRALSKNFITTAAAGSTPAGKREYVKECRP